MAGDVLQVLPTWPEASVDLVFADPPFNIEYQYDRYVDDLAYDEYVRWTGQWIDVCLRVLKPAGTMWVAIGDEYAAEMRLRNWVIWHYTFGPNCKQKFNRGHTHLFYVVKDPKAFTFNVGVELSEQYVGHAMERIAVEGRPDWKPSVTREGLSEVPVAQQRRRHAADPPRRRGRPRKNPPPLPDTGTEG